MQTIEAKYCKHCDAEFAVDDMEHWRVHKDESCVSGFYLRCKKRDKHLNAESYKRLSPSRRRTTAKYGITQADYNHMMVEQSDRCAICLTDDKGKNDHWHIDHSHETGEVRGLLCYKCNAALGMLGDDVDNLIQAINYLRGKKTNAHN